MKTTNAFFLISFALVLSLANSSLSWATPPFQESKLIQIKAGEMDLMSYLEMLSDTLQIQINASALEGHSATVTLSQGGAMTREQILTQAYSQLSLQGYTLIHEADFDVYRLLRLRDARDENVPFVADPEALPDNDKMVTHLIGPRYLPAEWVARNLRSFAPANSRIIPIGNSNMLFITDFARSMKKYREIISRLDTPQADREIKNFLKNRPATRDRCETTVNTPPLPTSALWIVLFGLIGTLFGFILRGYLIRRIEGGL